jgi:hypothetical protein
MPPNAPSSRCRSRRCKASCNPSATRSRIIRWSPRCRHGGLRQQLVDGRQTKIKLGDQMYYGGVVIELPDLSQLRVASR